MAGAINKRPSWESAFPGRMDWEIRCLQHFGAVDLQVDQEQLDHGVLQIDFKWPLRGEHILLRAIFPAAYDEMRPHVFLREPPETWPDKHVAPADGNICLLGRDSAQWRPDDGLAGLLNEQLEIALYGGGAEDPQGEPAEVWWNGLPIALANGSYCLVDSEWNLHGATAGLLELAVVTDPPGQSNGMLPRVRAVVRQIWGGDKDNLASWNSALPSEFQKPTHVFRVPWTRSGETILPKGNVLALLGKLLDNAAATTPKQLAGSWIRPFALVHPIDLTEDTGGEGWILGFDVAKRAHDFGSRKFQRHILPIYRAGKTDLGHRVPAFNVLADKRIAVIGVGALGAPIAIELARNGAAELHLLDHDTVEPGNSVRWPLGAAVWGSPKVQALKEHLKNQYPGCKVEPIDHAIGNHGRDRLTDDEALKRALNDVRLVVDASASFGVNRVLWRHCRALGVPMVRLGATPNVAGGTVSYHGPGGGCPVCIDIARGNKQVPAPPGQDDRASLAQPPGCGERTFRGADYDLGELSLQAVRIVVETLSKPLEGSLVCTLGLQPMPAGFRIPVWDVSVLDVQENCPCQATVVV